MPFGDRDHPGQVALVLDAGLVNRLDIPLADLARAGIDLNGMPVSASVTVAIADPATLRYCFDHMRLLTEPLFGHIPLVFVPPDRFLHEEPDTNPTARTVTRDIGLDERGARSSP